MQSIAVVASPDVSECFSPAEFSSCISNLAILLALSDKVMPKILVLHVSADIATCFGVDHPGVIRHNLCDKSGLPNYYEVWLVGNAEASDYVLAILGIFEDYFLLDLSPQERQRALESTVWRLANDSCTHDTIQ